MFFNDLLNHSTLEFRTLFSTFWKNCRSNLVILKNSLDHLFLRFLMFYIFFSAQIPKRASLLPFALHIVAFQLISFVDRRSKSRKRSLCDT